jgi:Tfp pilus assembly protein FimV
MAIRLDPRRLSALKLLAAEAGVRPGELVTQWVQERLDAARGGRPPSVAETADPGALAALAARVDQLAQRLDELESQRATAGDGTAPAARTAPSQQEAPAAPPAAAKQPKRATRQRKAAPKASGPRVPLHEEISAVISEQGPMTAGELATAIRERGRYAPPRSAKPLDAATVNARVSNPVYRSRFVRSEGRIGLANAS